MVDGLNTVIFWFHEYERSTYWYVNKMRNHAATQRSPWRTSSLCINEYTLRELMVMNSKSKGSKEYPLLLRGSNKSP